MFLVQKTIQTELFFGLTLDLKGKNGGLLERRYIKNDAVTIGFVGREGGTHDNAGGFSQAYDEIDAA